MHSTMHSPVVMLNGYIALNGYISLYEFIKDWFLLWYCQQICFKTGPLQCLRDVPHCLMYPNIIYNKPHAFRCIHTSCHKRFLVFIHLCSNDTATDDSSINIFNSVWAIPPLLISLHLHPFLLSSRLSTSLYERNDCFFAQFPQFIPRLLVLRILDHASSWLQLIDLNLSSSITITHHHYQLLQFRLCLYTWHIICL